MWKPGFSPLVKGARACWASREWAALKASEVGKSPQAASRAPPAASGASAAGPTPPVWSTTMSAVVPVRRSEFRRATAPGR